MFIWFEGLSWKDLVGCMWMEVELVEWMGKCVGIGCMVFWGFLWDNKFN